MRVDGTTDPEPGRLLGCVDGIRTWLVETAAFDRADCLWAADPTIFDTNPLNLAYGASGNLLFLAETAQDDFTNRVVAWILSHPVSVESYPPGLYVGLSGLAYALAHVGRAEEAESAFALAMRSPLLFDDQSMFQGVAGWGMAALSLSVTTTNERWLAYAQQAADHLCNQATTDGTGVHWAGPKSGANQLGFGYGGSGIALFLGHASSMTETARYAETAIEGLRYELSECVESSVGRQWRKTRDGAIVYPYWLHGTAGVAAAVLRCGVDLDRADLVDTAVELARECHVAHSYLPSQFYGLAGIGELMLDVYHHTREPEFRTRAHDTGSAIMRFAVRRPSGVTFPGRTLSRISGDYGTGAAGIGLFLHRLARGGPRLLLDLPAG